jgi:PAS domain S-box-containing protein
MPSLYVPVQPIWEVSPFSIAIIGYDLAPNDRKIVYVNPAFVKLTGYSTTEALGKPAGLLDGLVMDQATVRECETALGKGAPFVRPARRYRKDGSEYLSQVTVAPLLEPDGRSAFLISMETETLSSKHDKAQPDHRRLSSPPIPLTLPMPLKEFPGGQLPSHLASHPELVALRDLWTDMSADDGPPRRTRFDLEVMKRWASHLSIAAVLPGGRFHFRLYGTELERVYGRDLTHCYLDELSPTDLWSVIILHYQTVVQTRQPLFAPISICNGRWYSEVSRLLLPLSSDDCPVAFIMGADYARNCI